MSDNENIVLPVGWTAASVLVNATGDAMDNIFDILIEWPWNSIGENGTVATGAEAAASYRANGFDIPEPTTNTYDVSWHGTTVKKVSSGVKLDRAFTITFRLDANYALYQKFTAWKKLTSDVNTGGVANTESALGRIQVIAPGAEYNSMSWSTPTTASDTDNMLSTALDSTTNLVWTFEDVQCIGVGTPKFKNGSTGNKLEYQVKFIFGDCSYPFYTSANGVSHNRKQS